MSKIQGYQVFINQPRGRTVFDTDVDTRKKAFLSSDFLHIHLTKYILTGYSKVYFLTNLTLILSSRSHKQGKVNIQESSIRDRMGKNMKFIYKGNN